MLSLDDWIPRYLVLPVWVMVARGEGAQTEDDPKVAALRVGQVDIADKNCDALGAQPEAIIPADIKNRLAPRGARARLQACRGVPPREAKLRCILRPAGRLR